IETRCTDCKNAWFSNIGSVDVEVSIEMPVVVKMKNLTES
ncbi:hypothetical protein JL09_g7024, partial [Pichia kudriavzevii]